MGRNKKIRIWVTVGCVVLLLLLVKVLVQQNFDSVASLQNYIKKFGLFGPIALTVFQAFQVVVPVLPGYLGCAAGAVAFGSVTGFWCNYIGITLGSIGAYFLARKFGIDIVLTMFSQKAYDKWSAKLSNARSYETFLFVATLLPLFPDDFLCYFSGLIKMDRRKFLWIIILGKPWCILAYSLVFGLIQ